MPRHEIAATRRSPIPRKPIVNSAQCTVCQHPERHRLEMLVIGGASHRSVAEKFSTPQKKLTHHSVGRHMQAHVSEEKRASMLLGPVKLATLASRAAEESESVIDHLRALRSGLWQMFDVSLDAGDRSGGALVAGRLLECLTQIAKLTGQLLSSPTIQNNMTINNNFGAEFEQFKVDLIRVLQKHPQALTDVIREFERLDAEALPALEHRESQSA